MNFVTNYYFTNTDFNFVLLLFIFLLLPVLVLLQYYSFTVLFPWVLTEIKELPSYLGCPFGLDSCHVCICRCHMWQLPLRVPAHASCALYMVSVKALGDAWEIIPPRLYQEAEIQWGLAQQLGLSLQSLVSLPR